eukprot:10049221-Alexandrium_andersonii.AAC.1
MDKAFQKWEWFAAGISCIAALLHKQFRCERLVAACLLGAPGFGHRHLFTKAYRPIASWRSWGALSYTLSWLMPLREILDMCWGARKYRAAGEEEPRADAGQD